MVAMMMMMVQVFGQSLHYCKIILGYINAIRAKGSKANEIILLQCAWVL